MAEVGLLVFARTALEVGRAVLPPLSNSLQQAPIHAAAVAGHPLSDALRGLDLSRSPSADGLGEHRELRQTLGLSRVPDFTTVYRFLQRLDDQTLDRAVGETVRRMRGGRRGGRPGACVAVDATGLALGAVSTFFVRRLHHHGQNPLPWRYWLKWVVVADLDQQLLLSQSARRGPWNDGASLPTMVEAAAESANWRTHRVGAGRCRVRQREESHLYPSAAPGPECDPGQAGEEKLAGVRQLADRNAASVSAKALPAPRPDRERLVGEAQALGSRPRSLAPDADAPSPAARTEFQPLSLEASLSFPEDVNRAR